MNNSLDQRDLNYLAVLGFGFFIIGFIINAILWEIFKIPILGKIGDSVYGYMGSQGLFCACLLGPFIAAILAIYSGKVIYKFSNNKLLTYLSACLITAIYGFSPLAGLPLFG